MEVIDLPIRYWNALERPDECKVSAEEDDYLCAIDGYLFLLQRTNEGNNVVMFKKGYAKELIVEVLKAYIKYLKFKGIQYIRVEGNTKRYNFLYRYTDCYDGIVKADDIKDRNVFYIKLY